MTICIATSNFPPQTGGIATFYGHLAALLTKEGHRVIVLMPDNNTTEDKGDEVIEKNGLAIILLKKTYRNYLAEYTPYFPAGGLNAAGWIAAGLAMKDWLVQNYKAYNIDIIEASDYGGLGIFLLSKKLPPVVITGHGTFTQLCRYNEVKEDSQTELVRKLELLSLQKADVVIAHSPQNLADLEQLTKRAISFATAPWSGTEKENTTVSDDTVFVAGGLQKVKGAVAMAEAVTICAKQNENFRLYWAGGDTYTAPGATKMSEYLEKTFPVIWNKNFIWLNELSHADSMDKMARAGIVVIPSEWETFNYVALEAAVMNKAIIITSATGAAYLFRQGDNAWIVPPNDPQALAEAILHLQNDVTVRLQLGSHAAGTIKSTFTENKITEERINIYTRIIENREPATHNAKDELSFLKKYITPGRKYFFTFKAMLKRILRYH